MTKRGSLLGCVQMIMPFPIEMNECKQKKINSIFENFVVSGQKPSLTELPAQSVTSPCFDREVSIGSRVAKDQLNLSSPSIF